MNLKQKVAVVFGALVIAGLALFPPWRRWEEREVVTTVTEVPSELLGLRWFGTSPIAGSTRRDSRGKFRPDSRIDTDARNSLQVAVLALTVAAVVVLKERKGET